MTKPITASEEWDSMVEAANIALSRLTTKGDKLADLVDSTPSPEAIVLAALERAAEMGDECQRQNGPLFKRGFDEPYRRGLEAGGQAVASAIRSIADDPAEVAAIIKAAVEDQ